MRTIIGACWRSPPRNDAACNESAYPIKLTKSCSARKNIESSTVEVVYTAAAPFSPCRCLRAKSHGRMGGFLGWIVGTLARARAPDYGSGYKPAWLLRAPRGAKSGAPECPQGMVVLTTFTSLRLAATPPQCHSHVPSTLSQVRLVGELLLTSQGRHHYCHPGGRR